MSGLNDFMASIERAVDAPAPKRDGQEVRCALQALRSWAQARALTEEPGNTGGKVERLEHLVGLNLIALKARMDGLDLPPETMGWLGELERWIIADYAQQEQRNNLYDWSGASAALSTLLTGDRAAREYQDRVWHEALRKIRPDGSLDQEMERSHRALIYHQFAFSALLVLRTARGGLHDPVTQDDDAALRRLADRIGQGLCRPETMAAAAHAEQELPGDWGYRIPVVFGAGLLSQDWTRCGHRPQALNDIRMGGDLERSLQAIRWAAGAEHRSGTENKAPPSPDAASPGAAHVR
jgi:poly(beta-D-mannuronate) lyase